MSLDPRTWFGAREQAAPNIQSVLDEIGHIIEDAGIDESSGIGGQGLLNLALEDIGWIPVGSGADHGMPPHLRLQSVKRARAFSQHDPSSIHTVRLYRDFVIGTGVTVKAEKPSTQKTIDQFFASSQNKATLSTQGQRDTRDKRTVDGEIVFVLVPTNDSVKVRRVDNLQITEIVSNPEDVSEVWGYKREFTVGTQSKEWFYWDVFAPDEVKIVANVPAGFVLQEHPMYFAPYGRRNPSLLTGVMDWSKSYRKFMHARTAIQQALSDFAWKATSKGGGQKGIDDLKAKFQSGLVAGNTENNPQGAKAKVWAQTDAVDLAPLKTETGAQAAQFDGNQLITTIGMASGIATNWYWAGGATKFSEATTMQLPMLKMFQAEQALDVALYNDLIDFLLDEQEVAEGDRVFTVELPKITIQDIDSLLNALANIFRSDPALPSVPGVREHVLATAGIEGAAEALKAEREGPDGAGGRSEAEVAARMIRRVREVENALEPEGAKEGAMT